MTRRDTPHWSRLSTAQRFQPPNVNHYAETGHCPENGADKLWSEDGKSYARCQRCKATTQATVSGLTWKHKPRCEAVYDGRRCTELGDHGHHRAVEGSKAYTWVRGLVDQTPRPVTGFVATASGMTWREAMVLAAQIDADGAAYGVESAQNDDDLTTDDGRSVTRVGERGYTRVALRILGVRFVETGSTDAHMLASVLAYMAETERRIAEAKNNPS